jgi:Rrf2 family protein
MIGDIADAERIPRKFLEQILLQLKAEGLVESRRGRTGGYALLRGAGRISFAEVLRLIDGPIAPLPCLSTIAYRKCADCRSEKECEIRRVFSVVADSARTVLERTSIADALEPKPARTVPAPGRKRGTRPGSAAKKKTFPSRARN